MIKKKLHSILNRFHTKDCVPKSISISNEALTAFANLAPVCGGFSDVQRSDSVGALLFSFKMDSVA